MWKDLRLSWDPQNFGGIKRFSVNVDKVWIPDLMMYET